jgi:selenocysteine lyase/cysteine desulfurase
MHAALKTLLEFGKESIEQHILALSQILIEGFRSMEGVELYSPVAISERAGITTIRFKPPLDGKAIFNRLLERKITTGLREGLLRYSPHFYCTPEEMHATVETTKECIND